MKNIIMGFGRINTPNTARSNPNPRKRRIEKREKKIGGEEVSASVEEILREGGATPSKKKKAKQENKPVTDTIPEIVIQNGDGF